MEILKHFSSTQCQTLNNTVSANIQDFCTVAAVEIFIDCKKEHADSSTIDECLTSILGTLPSFSSLFSSCLCHGYIENYASMWAVWNMICDEDAPHTSFGDSSVGFFSINHEKSNVRVGRRVEYLPEEAFEYKLIGDIHNFLVSVIQIDSPYHDEFSKVLGGILAGFLEPHAWRRHELLKDSMLKLRNIEDNDYVDYDYEF